MAINLNQPYSATNNGQPVINPQQLAEQYGWAYSFLTSVPELNSLFQEAVAQSWDATRFQAELQATDWYKQNSESMRNAQVQKAIDPATYSQQVAAEKQSVQEQATSLGAAISDSLATTIATQQITYGWTTDQINKALAQYVTLNKSGAFGGQAAQNAMALYEMALNNGVTISPSNMQSMMQKVTAGSTSMEDLQGYIRAVAASKFPAQAKEIQSGTNVSDLAAPYTTAMQNVLEVGPGQANVSNPLVQQALNGLSSQGQPAGMNLTDFNNLLRAQPQWAQTQNAQTAAMSTAQTVLQNMGFAS
jgi:hypothetical protein